MKKISVVLFLFALALPVLGQVNWREATTSEMSAGTAGVPAVATPRRLSAAGGLVQQVSGNVSNAIATSSVSNNLTIPAGIHYVVDVCASNNVNFDLANGCWLILTNLYFFNNTYGDRTTIMFTDDQGDLQSPFDGLSSGYGRTNVVTGDGSLSIQIPDDSAAPFGFLYNSLFADFVNSNSVFYLHAHSVVQSNIFLDSNGRTVGGFLDAGARDFTVDIDTIDWDSEVMGFDGHGMAPFEWYAGNATYRAGKITVRGFASCILISDVTLEFGRPATSVSFNVGYLNASNAQYVAALPADRSGGHAINLDGNPAGLARWFVNCPRIDGGSASAIYNPGGTGIGFVSGLGAGVIRSFSTTNAIVQYGIGHGTNYLALSGFDKFADVNGGGFYSYGVAGLGGAIAGTCNFTNTGQMGINVNQFEELSSSYVDAFVIRSGTHTITSQRTMLLPNGRGFDISNAVVTLNGVSVDTSLSANPSNECVRLQGSNLTNLVTLNGGIYKSAAGVNAINATNAQTVYVNGANISSWSTNITFVGTWICNGVSFSSAAQAYYPAATAPTFAQIGSMTNVTFMWNSNPATSKVPTNWLQYYAAPSTLTTITHFP